MAIQRLCLVLGALSFTAILNSFTIPPTSAQEIDLDALCQNSPLNSRCEGYEAPPQAEHASETLENDADYVIRVKLETSGRDDEWVLIGLKFNPDEADGTLLEAYHSTRFVSNNLLTQVANGAINALAPIPIPFSFTNHDRSEQETQYVAFTPDSCQAGVFLEDDQRLGISDCTIAGTGVLTLPADIDIRAGLITLVYTEDNLIKSVTFRITEQEVEIGNEDELENLCQNYPLNSSCQYVPFSQADKPDES